MTQRFNTSDIVLTALMTSLVYIAGSIIKIPSLGGFVHIGDCMVFVSAFLLSPRKAAFASGVGMLLVDVLGGYMLWAPSTFIIKSVMALIAAQIIKQSLFGGYKVQLLAFGVAAIFMVIGYFIAGVIIASVLTGDVDSIMAGILFASRDIVPNIIQVITGIIIALPLCKLLSPIKNKHNNSL